MKHRVDHNDYWYALCPDDACLAAHNALTEARDKARRAMDRSDTSAYNRAIDDCDMAYQKWVDLGGTLERKA